ncbi:MAG TPA: response regulator transcription factor [Verrucomicrobiae bacterium]|nr:response regulator transcription factor [Verrucomicrobiae bacterium]
MKLNTFAPSSSPPRQPCASGGAGGAGALREPAEPSNLSQAELMRSPREAFGRLDRAGNEADEFVQATGVLMRTVVLADDHPVVRQSLKRLLNQQADLRLVGESNDGLETLGLVRQLQPDLLVTDLMMPGMNGLEVTRRIRLSFPATRIVVISVNGDAPYVAGAFRCGANGFVLKTSCGRHLIPAIRAVLAGRRYLSPPLVEAGWD